MLTLYFSGTGNSKYVAEMFCRYMNTESHPPECSDCYSIEEDRNFASLMEAAKNIAFCYPVYGSRVPKIMREFALMYREILEGKKVIIFCTQMLFSGDGARAFTDLFPRGFFEVIYAEHFLMPNNVCNFFLTPLASEAQVRKYLNNAERKMRTVCENIKAGVVKRRGFNIVSRLLGLPQGLFMPVLERKLQGSVKINSNCTQCGLCSSICPMKNLTAESGKIAQENNCIACYRCVNKCPEKAITVFFHGKVKKQYKGCSLQSGSPVN